MAEVHHFPASDPVFNPLWHGHDNVGEFLARVGVSDAASDLCVAADSFHDCLDLPDELSSICDDNHLHSIDSRVDSHNGWDTKRECFATTVCCLEQEVLIWALKDLGDRRSLDDTGSVHLEVFEGELQLLRDADVGPLLLLALEVGDDVLAFDLTHTLDKAVVGPTLGLFKLSLNQHRLKLFWVELRLGCVRIVLHERSKLADKV